MKLHLWGLTIWLNFTSKITKIHRSFRGLRPLGSHQGVALDPLEALRRPPDPMPLKKNPRPPPNQNSWIRPCTSFVNFPQHSTSECNVTDVVGNIGLKFQFQSPFLIHLLHAMTRKYMQDKSSKLDSNSCKTLSRFQSYAVYDSDCMYSEGSTYGSAPFPNHSCVFLFIF